MMNSLSDKKILKIDDTGNKFWKILGKYYETSFIHNSSLEVHDVTIEYAW